MASSRPFEKVTVNILHEDGSRTLKYPEPVTLRLEYDPHGLSCKVRQGKDPCACVCVCVYVFGLGIVA